jgi:hypothetical protein
VEFGQEVGSGGLCVCFFRSCYSIWSSFEPRQRDSVQRHLEENTSSPQVTYNWGWCYAELWGASILIVHSDTDEIDGFAVHPQRNQSALFHRSWIAKSWW